MPESNNPSAVLSNLYQSRAKYIIINTLHPDASLQELNLNCLQNLSEYWPIIEKIVKNLSLEITTIIAAPHHAQYFEKVTSQDITLKITTDLKEITPNEKVEIINLTNLLAIAGGELPFLIKGPLNKPGLYTASLETPLLELIYGHGQGLKKPHNQFKSILWGGSFGKLLSLKGLNLALNQGQGLDNAFMVFNDTTCIVNLVHILTLYNLQKTSSCAGCNFCPGNLRIGCDLLEKIVSGQGNNVDLENLEKLVQIQKDNASCLVGKNAFRPLETALENFYQEFREHTENRYCPASVCEKLFLSSCVNACPAGVDLPGTIGLMQKGLYQEAVALGREKNPFLLSCGRICEEPPCQKYCQRQTIDSPVHSRALHKYAGEAALAKKNSLQDILNYPSLNRQPSTGKKVAVVGAGPGGLANAYFLARYGHKVTVYEKHSVSGGMLRLGIPKYRLTRDILDAEINHILSLGVEIQYNTQIGKDITLTQLQQQFDAVFLAVGAHKSNLLGIKGEELPGVMSGIDFLAKVNLDERIDVGQQVIVVGGGNVAIDAARCALRLGAKDIKVVYRRDISDMPAAQEEIEALLAEGIEILPMTNPVEAIGDTKLREVKLDVMSPGPFDNSGRRKPLKTGKQLTLPVDTLIIAVGQNPDLEGLTHPDLHIKWDNIQVDRKTFKTSLEKVFAGGDCVSGPQTAVLAVGHGQKAAHAIHQYLLPNGKTGFATLRDLLKNYNGPATCQYREQERPRHLAVDQRSNNFNEVEKAYSPEESQREMERCICSAKTGL